MLSLIKIDADSTPPQKISCQGSICSLYALTAQGEKLVTKGKKSDLDAYYSGWTDPTTQLASFNLACGTACNYAYFVDYRTGQVSDSMYLVEDVNLAKRVVVLPNFTDNNDQSLLVRPIFSCTKGTIVQRAFNPDVENGISVIHFDKAGNLYIDYWSGPNNTEIKETIPIDYQKIAKICAESQPN